MEPRRELHHELRDKPNCRRLLRHVARHVASEARVALAREVHPLTIAAVTIRRLSLDKAEAKNGNGHDDEADEESIDHQR
jgi:hypothetical protein